MARLARTVFESVPHFEELSEFVKLSPDIFRYTSKIEIMQRESGYVPRILEVFLGNLMPYNDSKND